MTEQKLKKVDATLRKLIALSTDTNRRMADNYRREQERRKGRNVCARCGAEPCGHLWTRPSDGDMPGGQRCCDECTHRAVEGWQHTHTAWAGAAHYPVCAIRMEAGDVAYMRRDGVVLWLEMSRPRPDGAGAEPTVAFLGEDGGTALYTVGEGAAEDVNLWNNKPELDIVWLPIRMSAAVAADETRKRALAERLEAEARAWQEREDARRATDQARLEGSIERRALAHETRIVMETLGGDDADGDAEADLDLETEPESEPETEAEPARKLTSAELKRPAAVKATTGRPKRSWRQRRARERQKRAWAKQEAAQRLQVKRLAREAREREEAGKEAEMLVSRKS